ncbi:MAG TPA: tRNA epoxyqueuosine(34) reductase QueG [Terriglobales bacterium]
MQGSLASAVSFHEAAHSAAQQAGFDLCGVVRYPFPEVDAFEQWIADRHHGDMSYLATSNENGELRRKHLQAAIPWARSVVVCALNYNPDAPYSTEMTDPNRGWISRYAIGGRDGKCTDYHDALMSRLRRVEADIKEQFGDFQSRCYVDTGPIVERALAQAAGIGWIGKNTCLINERERLGSWIFLGVIVTGYDLDQAGEALATLPAANRCGTCTRCIDACPTDALVGPGQMDARRCIAYLTIEKRGSIEEELRPLIGNNVFGCDICQDVCPWNRRDSLPPRSPATSLAEFSARPELVAPELERLASLTVEHWREMFRGSPVKRTKYQGFLRNVCIAMGNSGDTRYLSRLQELAVSEDAVVAEHARWAMARISLSQSRLKHKELHPQ